MPPRKGSKRARLEELLTPFERVEEPVWAQLRQALSPISDSYLRALLKQSGHSLAPLVEGVEIGELSSAQRTLCALASEYQRADAIRRKECRRVVIESKDRLRWWLKRPSAAEFPEKRKEKEEILLWVSTWLENPDLFPEWVLLRQKQTIATRMNPP